MSNRKASHYCRETRNYAKFGSIVKIILLLAIALAMVMSHAGEQQGKKTLAVPKDAYVKLDSQSTGARSGFFITLQVPGTSKPFLLCGSFSNLHCLEWLKKQVEVDCYRWKDFPLHLKISRLGSTEPYSERSCPQDLATKISLEAAAVRVEGRDVVEILDRAGFPIVSEQVLKDERRTGAIDKMYDTAKFIIIFAVIFLIPIYNLKASIGKKGHK